MLIYGYIPKSKKRKVSKAKKLQNEEWLASIKLISPKTTIPTSKSKTLTGYLSSIPAGRETPKIASLDTGFRGALTKSGIMKDYHKMTLAERDKIDYTGTCVAPLHKGNYIYITPGMNPAGFGRKNEVL
jgi:hypothetical protein